MEVQLIMYTRTYSTLRVFFILKTKTHHTKLHEYKSTQTFLSWYIMKLLIIIFI